MKNFGLAVLLALLPASSFASGCGSNENFRQILDTKDDGGPGRLMFEIVRADLKDANIKTGGKFYTLEYKNEVAFVPNAEGYAPRVFVRDVKFTEGNGCGPVYNCVSGQYTLVIPDFNTKTARIYEYPRIDEFSDFNGRGMNWAAQNVIPTIFGLANPGEASDLRQCVWGQW